MGYKAELSEHDIQNQILSYLQYAGYMVWRNNTGVAKYEGNGKTRMVRFGQAGHADIFLIDHKNQGRFVAIEVKKPSTKKNLTRWQQEFIDNVNSKGGFAFVATSIEEVEAQLL